MRDEIAGGLKETGDPLDPYGISETEARKWDEPRDFWDVLKDPLWREWIKAIRKEMQGFEENNVFSRTRREDVPPDKKVIPNKEVYTRKYKNGRLMRHKYRHTARGDKLRAGIDYGNSYWSSASSACTNAKRCDSERAAFNLRADGNLPESHLSVN